MKSFFPYFRISFLLFCFSVIDSGMWLFRFLHYNSGAYKGLIWNLFLAWIPYVISILSVIFYKNTQKKQFFLLIFGFLWLVWLLFFPNAPYIITDLIHLGKRKFLKIPLWYDAMMIFSFALTGLLLAFMSLLLMQEILEKFIKKIGAWIVTILALWACGFGIYLGRVERWNSWDVISERKLHKLIFSVLEKILYPFKFWESSAMTFLFFVLLFMAYLTFKSMIHKRAI